MKKKVKVSMKPKMGVKATKKMVAVTKKGGKCKMCGKSC